MTECVIVILHSICPGKECMRSRLTFSEFEAYVREHILTDWCAGRTLDIHKIKKNNGVELTAMLIPEEGCCITPTFYLEDFYEMYLQDGHLPELVDWIRERYRLAEESVAGVNVAKLLNYEAVKDRIIMKMVHYEKNEEMLESCPHIKVYDLAVTFRTLVSLDPSTVSSALVTYQQLDQWGISISDLLLTAEKNTRRLFPSEICTIEEFLEEHCDYPVYDIGDIFYVVTNDHMINGATVMLYDGLLEEFAEKIGGDFYILPSSIHEVLFVPDRGAVTAGELIAIVHEANETVINESDILSDSVYYYKKKEHQLICCRQGCAVG